MTSKSLTSETGTNKPLASIKAKGVSKIQDENTIQISYSEKGVKQYCADIKKQTKQHIYNIASKNGEQINFITSKYAKNKILVKGKYKGSLWNIIKDFHEGFISSALGLMFFGVFILGLQFPFSEKTKDMHVLIQLFYFLLGCLSTVAFISIIVHRYNVTKFMFKTGYSKDIFENIDNMQGQMIGVSDRSIYMSYCENDRICLKKYDYRDINYVKSDVKNGLKVITIMGFNGVELYNFICSTDEKHDAIFAELEARIQSNGRKFLGERNDI